MGTIFPFQNVRIFENRSTNVAGMIYIDFWKIEFSKISDSDFSQKRYFSNGNPMQNRWCGSNIRTFHHRSGNFRSCLEAARFRASWAARCEFFNDLKITINLRLVSFQNVAPHSLGCREQKLVHMDMASSTDLVLISWNSSCRSRKKIPDTLRHNSGNSALYIEAWSLN